MVRLVEIGVTVIWCVIWLGAIGAIAYFGDKAKRRRALVITSFLFAALPIWIWGSYPYYAYIAQRDYEIFQDLCRKHAGDKITRRVTGVDAVFQTRARDPSGEVTHKDNQYVMQDPFGAIGDVGSGHGPGIFLDWRVGVHYQVFERPKSTGAKDGPPYLRFAANVDRNASVGSRRLEIRSEEVGTLRSRYGYAWEDISTEDMRSRWIAGGRIRVLDLTAGEVLAERTGFYFGRRLNGALTKHPWAGSGETCPPKHFTSEFVKSVLIPKNM